MTKDSVDKDDIAFLKDQVKSKYGSVRTFTLKTGLPYRKGLELFNRFSTTEEFFNKVKTAFYETKHLQGDIGRINDSDREAIRVCILTNFKSATAFCRRHRRFDNVYVSNIISGRLKLSTLKYRKLVLVLEKRYELLIEE